ncbi:MAG: phospholipase D-like domain-containing protein [Acidimicrobiales bacterium]
MGRPGTRVAPAGARTPTAEPDSDQSDRDDVFECRTWFEGLLGVPATEGNRVEILRNGDRIFFAMLEAAEAAEKTIDFATFNFGGSIASEFARVLTAKAREGVRVRILLDRIGSVGADRGCLDDLRRAGASVAWFRPLANPRIWETFHRGHRKVLVCDRKVAFTGGVGVDDRWLGDARNPDERRDTHFRVRGPAVDGLHGAFVNNWAETGLPLFDDAVDDFEPQPVAGFSTVQVVRAGARTGWGDIATLMGVLLTFARKRLRIASAYFVPDKHVLAMLCEAARRGVQVQVLVNGAHSDKWISRLATQGQYEPMLDAGIEVWCYRPTMLHIKQITIDGIAASVGSANLNARSMMQDEELNLAIFDPMVVKLLDEHFDDDLAHAERVDADRWSTRSRGQKALELVPGVVARHL